VGIPELRRAIADKLARDNHLYVVFAKALRNDPGELGIVLHKQHSHGAKATQKTAARMHERRGMRPGVPPIANRRGPPVRLALS